jgi:class 3 adenylate cyclase
MNLSEPDAQEIKRLESAGDYLQAYDLATQAMAAHPDDVQLRYLAVRALARSGATRQALDLYARYDLGGQGDADCLSLRARLEKDVALASGGAGRAPRLRRAAALYEDVHRRLGGYYPAINAATLYLLAGDESRAAGCACEALAWCARRGDGEDGLDEYYRIASQAEAHLVLGETTEAQQALHRLASISRDDLAARASTRRQLRRILEARAQADSVLDPLAPPKILHYTGHMIAAPGGASGLEAAAEPVLAGAVADSLDRTRIGAAFGSLACGSDILFAEACLQRNVELNLVLPFNIAEFVATSVRPGGEGWVERFEAVRRRAASITLATDGDYLGDDSLFAYCSELAMGKAILRARYIDADVAQFAVWDGKPAATISGAAADVARWRESGHDSRIIAVERRPAGADAGQDRAESGRRELRALMFGDTVGFSRLPERLLRTYNKEFLGAIAGATRSYGASVLSANSWGDAIYMVVEDAVHAARCAIEIQRCLAAVDYRALGFPEALQLRLSTHYGPVFPGIDEITGVPTYFGKEVTFAARMEPVTPPSEVYATEEMACQLALRREATVAADYVGRVALAKKFGTAPMYRLRPAEPAAA